MTEEPGIALVSGVDDGVFMGWLREWEMPIVMPLLGTLSEGDFIKRRIIEVSRTYKWQETLRTEGKVQFDYIYYVQLRLFFYKSGGGRGGGGV